VFILDLAMPRLSGLQAARALLAVRPDARIILLTANLTVAAVKEAQGMGLAGYLLKGQDPDELVRHVRAVAAGGTAWGNSVLASVPPKGQSAPSERSSSDHGERRHDEGMPMAAPM
jgi:DNA-binding NarL/FixJ family response regulator